MSSTSLEDEITRFIASARRIAILGIGNDLRSDDGVGLYIVSRLEADRSFVMIENVGSVPEAFARPIAEFGSERIILIDAADMGLPPGSVRLVTKEHISGVALTTHALPLSFLMLYLEQETHGQTILIGIQPENIAFGEGLTTAVVNSAEKIIIMLNRILQRHVEALTHVQDD